MGPKRKFTTRLCKVQCFTFTFWLCNANVFSDFAFLFYGTRYYWFVQDIPISKFQPNKKENIEERRRRLWRQGSGWENTFLMITLLKFRSMGMFLFFQDIDILVSECIGYHFHWNDWFRAKFIWRLCTKKGRSGQFIGLQNQISHTFLIPTKLWLQMSMVWKDEIFFVWNIHNLILVFLFT